MPITFILVQRIQIQFIAKQTTEVWITVARSDSARKRSSLIAGQKWKKMFLVNFVIWYNENSRKMLRLPAILRNEKWEQLSLKQKFYYSVGYLSKMFSSAYQYCFHCAQV